MNSFDDLEGAQEWVDAIMTDPDPYLLFEEEPIGDLVSGVVATTHVDAHKDQITVESLLEMAGCLSERPIWMHAHHDPRIHPIGRVLAVRVFKNVRDGHHYLVQVGGLFQMDRLPTTDTLPAVPDVGPEFFALPEGEPPSPQASVLFSRSELDPALIRDLLAPAPMLVSKVPRHTVRKAFESIPLIEFSVAAWLLLANPFSKAFLSRLGERAADAVIDFYKWLGGEVQDWLSGPELENAIEMITTEHEGIRFEFLLPRPELSESRLAAIESLGTGTRTAFLHAQQMERLQPVRITCTYDPEDGWQLEYAATRLAGVIVKEPTDVDISDCRGFSFSGEITRFSLEESDSNPTAESDN